MSDEQFQSDEPEGRPHRDDRPRRRPADDYDDDDYSGRVREEGDATGGLIPYKNPKALIGYYMGVFSLIPCAALLLGPIAILLGVLGLSYRKKHPTAGGTAHAWVAIVLGSLTTLGNLGVIAMMAIAAAAK